MHNTVVQRIVNEQLGAPESASVWFRPQSALAGRLNPLNMSVLKRLANRCQEHGVKINADGWMYVFLCCGICCSKTKKEKKREKKDAKGIKSDLF